MSRNQRSSWFQLAKMRLTTIRVQCHQQLAVGSDDDRRQESNRREPSCGSASLASNVRIGSDLPYLTPTLMYDTVIHVEEVLTIRLPKGTRRRLERRAKAQKLSVSQLVRRALEQEELLTSLAWARTELIPQARARGIYTDEDVFAIVS